MKACLRMRLAEFKTACLFLERICRRIIIQTRPTLKGERSVVAKDGYKQKWRRNSDGNLVNVGKADAGGANVNGWKPDNRNGYLGVSFSRSLAQRKGVLFYAFLRIPLNYEISNFSVISA